MSYKPLVLALADEPFFQFHSERRAWRFSVVGGIPRMETIVHRPGDPLDKGRNSNAWVLCSLDKESSVAVDGACRLLVRLQAAERQRYRDQRELIRMKNLLIEHGIAVGWTPAAPLAEDVANAPWMGEAVMA